MPLKPRFDIALNFLGPEGQLCVCVLHYTGNAPANQSQTQAMADTVSGLWAADAKPVITTECSFTGVGLRYISDAVSFDAPSTEGSGAGTVTGDTCPAEVAAIFRKVGTGPAKRARGTTYWPCVPEAYNDSSNLNATGIDAYGPIRVQLVEAITTPHGVLTPVILSRAADTLFPIVSSSTNVLLGGQRRRRPGA